MKIKQSIRHDQDTPWKRIIEDLLPHFMAFFFHSVFILIDWSRPPVPLDAELAKIKAHHGSKNRVTDKLFKVWLLNGQEIWILLHIEIQARKDDTLPLRIFTCRYQLMDKHPDIPIMSIAVLADSDETWRPTSYHIDAFNNQLSFQFAMVKLIDFKQREQELEDSSNPFALAVLTHLKMLATKSKSPIAMTNRFQFKLQLTRRLIQSQYTAQDRRNLFCFIDWILDLPPELEIDYTIESQALLGDETMSYVSSFERVARRQGIEEGLQQGLEKGLQQGREEGRVEGQRRW